MIAAILDFDEKKQSILVVVIETDNLERMKKADPITLESTLSGGLLKPPKYPQNFSILISYEADQDDLYRRARQDPLAMLQWLERGRVFIKGVDGISEAFRIPRAEDGGK